MQANKEFGLAGKKVLNDDSIIHCAMSIQCRMQEAHLQVLPHFATDSLLPLPCVVTMLMTHKQCRFTGATVRHSDCIQCAQLGMC